MNLSPSTTELFCLGRSEHPDDAGPSQQGGLWLHQHPERRNRCALTRTNAILRIQLFSPNKVCQPVPPDRASRFSHDRTAAAVQAFFQSCLPTRMCPLSECWAILKTQEDFIPQKAATVQQFISKTPTIPSLRILANEKPLAHPHKLSCA